MKVAPKKNSVTTQKIDSIIGETNTMHAGWSADSSAQKVASYLVMVIGLAGVGKAGAQGAARAEAAPQQPCVG